MEGFERRMLASVQAKRMGYTKGLRGLAQENLVVCRVNRLLWDQWMIFLYITLQRENVRVRRHSFPDLTREGPGRSYRGFSRIFLLAIELPKPQLGR